MIKKIDSLDLRKTSIYAGLTLSSPEMILSDGEVAMATSTAEKSVMAGQNRPDELGILRKSSLNIIRLGLLAALILGAPFSFAPSIASPVLNFPSFRIGLYQLLVVAFVATCIVPTVQSFAKLKSSHKIAFFSVISLIAISIIGLLWATDFTRSLLMVGSVTLLLLLVLCAWWFTQTQLRTIPSQFIRLFLFMGILFAGLALIQLTYGTFADSGGLLCKGCKSNIFGYPRVNVTAAEPLFFANALLPFLFIAFLASLQKHRLAYASLFATTLAISLTFARGAFIAAVFGLGVTSAVLIVRKYIPIKTLALPFIIMFLGGFVAISLLVTSATIRYHDTTPNITYNTIRSSLDHLSLGIIQLPDRTIVVQPVVVDNPSDDFESPGLIEASTNERLDSAELALKALTNTPLQTLFGTALGNLGPYVVANINTSAPYSLTVYIFYILLLAEVGIIGLLAYLTLVFYIIVTLYKKSRQHVLFVGLLGAITAFTAQYFFFGSYINTMYIWLYFGIALGLSANTKVQLPDIIQPLRSTKRHKTHEK